MLAERVLGATVHVLDDGFQHLQLDRDIDLVIVGREDVERPATLPFGRLREPLDALVARRRRADRRTTTVVVESGGRRTCRSFRLRRSPPRDRGIPRRGRRRQPVVAVAGIASPERFFDALTAPAGASPRRWRSAITIATRRAISARIADAAAAAGAALMLTTEKDAVRLLPPRPWPLPVVSCRSQLTPEPSGEFRDVDCRRARGVRGASRG